MSPLWFWVAIAGAIAVAAFRVRVTGAGGQPLVRANHAGRPVPVVLGRVLVGSANAALAVALVLAVLAGPVPEWPVAVAVLVGTHLLLLVGGLDDRSTAAQRGLRGHLRALVRGHVTTGIWKLIVGVALAIVIAVLLEDHLGRVIVAALVIALAVNVTNALDVRPGRALKWSGLSLLVLSLLVLLGRADTGVVLAAAAYLGAAIAVLPADLGERGMLGDAGSNPLGLVVGTALVAILPFPGVLAALVVLVGLQAAAETVTISRLIDAAPPLRWLDRFGRRN